MMHEVQRQRLIKQRAVAKGMLTCFQNYIDAGDKLNELQVRSNKLSVILNRYDTARSELQLPDDTDRTSDRESFEIQCFQVEARFTELLHAVIEPLHSRHRSPQSNVSSQSNQTRGVHIHLHAVACQGKVIKHHDHTSSYNQFHCQHLHVIHSHGCITDMHLKHC
jgi:hypothetical protein